MIDPIIPYDLPQPAKAQLLDLAAQSDLLLLGETHRTREVPRLVLGLLDDLAAPGYGGLGLEIGDDGSLREGETWTDRDRHIAERLLKQWGECCAGQKAVAVCGNYHSRLAAPAEPDHGPWPSLGYRLPRGHFSDMEEKSFLPAKIPLIGDAEVRPGGWLGHTVELHLPRATPATFLEEQGMGKEE